jgi:cyclohexanone monooxygenase
MPKQKYSDGDEILEHHRRIARHYDLYRDVCFQTRIERLRWDEDAARWIISTNRSDRMRAHYVAMALGPLNRPKLPGIPGVNDFEGHAFHACRWDYAYTGGDSHGNLTGLRGKRVGILGTGATAVQVVPHVAEAAEHLYVFQRTPSSVDVKVNTPTDPEWVKSLRPGWYQRRMDNFNVLVSGGFQEEDLVNDTWTDIIRKLLVMVRREDEPDLSPEQLMKKMELADFEKMEQIRTRVDSIVKDPETAEALKPYYRQFCKRPCIHNEYLPTFNRPNVTLVDTRGKGVDRVTKKGVVVDGTEYELDCLIYASGFEVGTSYARRAGYDVVGRGGQSQRPATTTMRGSPTSGAHRTASTAPARSRSSGCSRTGARTGGSGGSSSARQTPRSGPARRRRALRSARSRARRGARAPRAGAPSLRAARRSEVRRRSARRPAAGGRRGRARPRIGCAA